MFQKVILVGNLGGSPELRYTPGGQAVANFSMATNKSWNDAQGERQERTTWWRVTCWGKLGEVASKYLSKGRQVMVEGRMNPDPETGGPKVWEARDGTARASYEVTAQVVKFLGRREEYDDAVQSAEPEEIPF